MKRSDRDMVEQGMFGNDMVWWEWKCKAAQRENTGKQTQSGDMVAGKYDIADNIAGQQRIK
jgi:hypothetical protein